MFLTRADVERLTGRTRFSAQRRALDRLGVRYTVAATGEPLVVQAAIKVGAPERQRGHRWDRIGGSGATITPLARSRR